MKQNIVTTLKRAGITARAYKRPVDRGLFMLSIKSDCPQGTILVNHGNADVEIHSSKRHRQATMSVKEDGRKVRRKVVTTIYQDDRPINSLVRQRLISNFPINMPGSVEWSVSRVSLEERNQTRFSGEKTKNWVARGIVQAWVKGPTINHFLMGMDETRNFICALPRRARSVSEAREILRPNEARKEGTKRQGEWFFVPVSRQDQHRLNKETTGHPTHLGSLTLTNKLGGQTHIAKSAIQTRLSRNTRLHTYVRGYIVDNRSGHHKALFLPTWHKVVQNREQGIRVNPALADAQSAVRRQRSWD